MIELLELKNKTLELFGIDSVEELGKALMDACINHDIEKFRAFDELTEHDKTRDYLQIIYQYYMADLSDSFAVVGCKAEKGQFVTLSKNAAEFKIENKSKERIPEMILLFVNMWKQHIMYLNNEQNIILAEFRDALLNDLMSGKIDVSKGEKE